MALSIIFVFEERWYPAVAVFAIAFLLKPTSIIFAPFIALLFLRHFNLKRIIISALIFSSIVFIITTPFADFNIINLYFHDLGKYSYASLHAYNIHSLLGGDLVWDTNLIKNLGISYKNFGYLCFSVFFVLLSTLFFLTKNKNHIFLFMWIYLSGVFIFMPRIHERYMYFVIMFSLLALINSRGVKLKIIAILQSLVVFINHFQVLYFSYDELKIIKDLWINQYNLLMKVFSGINILVFLFLLFYGVVEIWSNRNEIVSKSDGG